MIKLERPALGAKDVFVECISRVRNADLRRRLASVSADVGAASDQFDALARENRLFEFVRDNDFLGVVDGAEMEAVYTGRMAKKGAPGRDAYDRLLALAPDGLCPLCGHRTVSTLDHYLPKTRYPDLVVVPLNLVPACADCNKAKRAVLPKTSREEGLHPYYDDIDGGQWLHADLVRSTPATVRFRIACPPDWNEVLRDRVELHFTSLGLGRLYASRVAVELASIRHQLRKVHQILGLDGVRRELLDRIESDQAVRLNGWRPAAFQAFAASDWFCHEGYAAT